MQLLKEILLSFVNDMSMQDLLLWIFVELYKELKPGYRGNIPTTRKKVNNFKIK